MTNQKLLRKLSSYELRGLCIEHDLFNGGSVEQYTKLFELNDNAVFESNKDLGQYTWNLSLIIWTCTTDKTLNEIQTILALKIDELGLEI